MRTPGKRNRRLASLILALTSLASLLVLAGYPSNHPSRHNFQRVSAAVLPRTAQLVCPVSIDLLR